MKPTSLTAGCVLLLVMSSCMQRDRITKRHVEFTQGASDVAMMTYNILRDTGGDDPNGWDRRRDLVLDVIADHLPDVIGLQEVVNHQMHDIKLALPQYKGISVGRDDGKRAGEACPILYRHARYHVTDSGTFWFSNTPWKAGSRHWGNEYPRICTWVRLSEIGNGQSFYVYNLHLDHQSKDSRRHSMKLLIKHVSNRTHEDPVIVMGDFNMDINDPAMAIISKNSKRVELIDVWGYLHPDQPSITTYQAFGAKPDGPCLDHILIDESIDLIEAAIDARSFSGRYPSDHFPVIARVRLNAD